MPILRSLVLFLFIGCLGSVFLSCHHPDSAQTYYLDTLRVKYADRIQAGNIDLAAIETRVYWTRTTCKNGRIGLYHKMRDKKDYACYRGLTWSCTEMYVADVTPLSKSAFIHELGHCYYLGLYGFKDVDHADKEFWEHVDTVDGDLKRRGW